MEALVIVDVQNDFVTGSLGSSEGLEIIPKVNSLIQKFDDKLIIFTQDSHPSDHVSFGLWPKHCVKNTSGEQVYSDILIPKNSLFCKKGEDSQVEAYSAFIDARGNPSSPLDSVLKKHEVKSVAICGIAGDFCVDATLTDALKLGYEVHAFVDAVAFIDPSKRSEYVEKWSNLGAIIEKF